MAADLSLLKWTLVSTDGGQYSSSYTAACMLQPDNQVYCTKRKENVNVVLESAEESPPTVTHVIVKAPEERYPMDAGVSHSLRFTAPVGEGLIWISHTPIQPSDTIAFDGFDEKKYAQWALRKKAMGEPVTELDPATYFDLQKGWCLIQKLDVPRTGRFILIKFLRSRVPTADKIDVQYIGFKGFLGPRSFAYAELC